MNIFNSLLAQLVKYDVHTTRKINSIHAIFYHILPSVMLLAAATTATCQVVADVGHGEDACTCLRQQPH